MEGGTKVGAAAPISGTVSDDVDERTIFVRSLPYTVTDAQVTFLLIFYLLGFSLLFSDWLILHYW